MHKHNRADANKQFYSALPRPDNGCWVWGVKSNETDREQQLSVCGNGGWKGREGGGGVGVESRHKCPCQDQTREGLTTTTSPKWHQSQLQEKRCWCLITEWESPPSLLSGRLVWAHARSPRWAGRQGWTWKGSGELKQAAVLSSEVSSLSKLTVDSRAERHQNLIGFWKVDLFSCFIPCSLSLFVWEAKDWITQEVKLECLFAHKDALKARLKLAELHL